VYLLSFISEVSLAYKVFFVIFLAVFFILYFFFWRGGFSNKIFFALLVIVPFSFGGTDASYIKSPGGFSGSVFSYFISYKVLGFNWHGDTVSSYPSVRVVDNPFSYNKIFFIVNESWGVPTDSRIQEALLGEIGVSYKYGEIPFRGVTVQGEVRELCGTFFQTYDMTNVDFDEYQCLPKLAQEKKYRTIAFHGASGTMYGRKEWYPKIGFEQSLFFEDFSFSRRCYSFPGACDSDVLGLISDKYYESENLFIYWLTLNTHSIYDLRDLDYDFLDCEPFFIPSQEACRNLKLQNQFFHNIGKFIKSHPDAYIIIVGDHEPRLISSQEGFEKGVVPYVVINGK
jgi:hypothetical protein